MTRDKRINLQATAAEQDMLRALADHEGLNMSDYLRQLIRKRHADVFGEQQTPKAKGKRK